MKEYFNNLAGLVNKNNSISDDMFKYYDIKRGLRNRDGSGVFVGITEISSVLGYIKTDEELTPVDGKLFYRGYDVEELVKGVEDDCCKFGYEECAYLLLAGQLPDDENFDKFNKLLINQRELPSNFVRDELSTYRSPDIMAALSAATMTLYSQDSNPDDCSLENVLSQGISLISKFPVIVAYAYRVFLEIHKNKSLIIHKSKPEYSTAENFLHLIRKTGEFTETEAKILDLALMLHADHGGGNNSTFAVRVVSSSGTDTYSAVTAGIGSLKGPLHGGANLFVMNMMEDLKANVKDWSNEGELKDYIKKIINKEVGNKSGKVYGFGHAVYTLSDPRATVFKGYAKQLAKEKGRLEEFELYDALERLVPEVFYSIKGDGKKISANVDFYSGFVYDCMDIPKEVYTPMFAMARVSGWIAHRIEEILVQKKIMRPAYKNVTKRKDYIKMENR